jgi:hypothetical protein
MTAKITRQQWYSMKFVLIEMVKCLQDRELAFIEKNMQKPTYRYNIAHHHSHLIALMEHFGILEKSEQYNLYHSLALLKDIPLMSFAPGLRIKQQEALKDSFSEHCVGWDWGIDIDSEKGTLEDAYDSLKGLKRELDKRKVPYHVKFSGARGFHVVIPSEYLPKTEDYTERVKVCGTITDNLKAAYNYCFDTRVYDIKRLWKLPYSWDRGHIALPLTDQQIDHWTLDTCLPENVLYQTKIFNRGLLLRTHGQNTEELQASVTKLIRDWQ